MEAPNFPSIAQVPKVLWEQTPEDIQQLVQLLLEKVRRDRSISERESHLTQLLDALPVGVSVHDPTGQITYINQRGRAILGIHQTPDANTEEMAALFQVYRAGTQAPYPSTELPIVLALAGQEVYADDMELHLSGRVVSLDVWAKAFKDEQGSVAYAIVAFQDISDRKRQEVEYQQVLQALRVNEERYRQVVETQTDFVLQSLPDTTITFANASLCHALGEPLHRVIGCKWIDFANPEDLDSILGQIAALSPDHPSFYAENRDRRADGQVGWTQWLNQGLFNNQGELIAIQSVGRDITALKEAEEALRESNARFQNMAANVPGAVFRYLLRTDGSNAVLYMSPGCFGLWEVDAATVEEDASVLWQMVHPDDIAGMYASVMESAQTLQPWFHKWRITTPSRREKWLEAAGQPTRQPNGDVIWDTLILDVSDRVQAEQRLQTLAANTPGIIYQYVLHADGSVAMLYVSPGCHHIWEVEAQDIMRDVSVLWEMVHPEDLPAMQGSVLASAETLEHWNWEWRIITPSGRLRWLQASAKPQRQGNGDVVWDGLILDVSDRKFVEAALRESEAKYRYLINQLHAGVVVHAPDTSIVMGNPMACDLLGLTLDQLMGRTAIDPAWCFLKDDGTPMPMSEYPVNLVSTTGQALKNYVVGINRPHDQSRIWVLVNAFPELDEHQQIQQIVVTFIDITDSKQAELALRESEERYRLLAENTNDLVCLHDPEGIYIYVSPSCEFLLGYHYREMVGQDPYRFFHPEDRDRIRREAHTAALSGKPHPITYRMRHKAGHYIWMETLTKPLIDDRGQVTQLQTVSRDVTQRIRVQEQLKHEALHDALTGLPNRSLLMERLELAIRRTERSPNYHYAVLFLDLDRFKVINDSLGHLVGDQLLLRTTQILQSVLRSTDLAARLGGDEFVILLEELKTVQEAVRVAERIFAKLRRPFILEGREVFTSTSIGIVWGTPHYQEPSTLLRDADLAMYRAKANGKARYEIFDTAMHSRALQRLHLENDLRRAIEREEFVVYYQPIAALETGNLEGFEALVRWQHTTQGLVSPGYFITVAEETGLITQIDRWIMRAVCQQIAQWREQLLIPDSSLPKVSVNLSAQDLWNKQLVEEISGVLSEFRLPGHCLHLEITESMLIDNVDTTRNLLMCLQALGIRISIDDFGTGYSSLSYLHQLPIDTLKIDRSFVNQMLESPRNQQIVATIITLAQQLGMRAIAEGIETQEQLNALAQLGCSLGQGYLFAKPLTAEVATTVLTSNSN
jgi:diguanylate cyclase (GGDEF)-like protein/PAS domain S-box-containing protein